MPQYLAIGMSADEFWHGDFRLCKAYREAWRVSNEASDVRQWKMGLYVLQALGAALNGKESPYPKFPLFGSEESRAIAEQAEQKRLMEKNKAAIEAFAAKFNAEFQKKQNE